MKRSGRIFTAKDFVPRSPRVLSTDALQVSFLRMVSRAKIRAFCDAVAKLFRPRKIFLFGSHAYGRPTANSDVDILVIMPRTRIRGERISLRIRRTVPRDFPLDLLLRPATEVANGLAWGDCFLKEVVKKGKVMYEAHDTAVGPKT